MNSSEEAAAEVASDVGAERHAAERQRDQAHDLTEYAARLVAGQSTAAGRQVCTPDPN